MLASRWRSMANKRWPPPSLGLHLAYYVGFSVVGYVALKISKSKATHHPRDLDLFFTSVSAATVSSMSTLNMQVFSNSQLILLTLLMFLGGEVLVSLLSFYYFSHFHSPGYHDHHHPSVPLESIVVSYRTGGADVESSERDTASNIKDKASRCLHFVVLFYLLGIHVVGTLSVFLYVSLVDSARDVLESKGISLLTFSVFTTVSSFANCGFVPTNENMVIFQENSGLLLLLLPQILLGNTLYPCSLRFLLWVLSKLTKRPELGYVLENYSDMGYSHLFSPQRCALLATTVFGFIFLQLVLFCSLEWNSESLGGMNSYEKFVGALFQVVNSRHAGESIVDLSTLSSAVLVLFVLMMYLPPYTSYTPPNLKEEKKKNEDKNEQKKEGLWVSQLASLSIFVVLISITERHNLKHDPLNFNVLSITLEVISAFGNVGFSTGYSCQRRLIPAPASSCQDIWYGFAGRWSPNGKFLLILVMFFGRLKNFSANAGNAWLLYP